MADPQKIEPERCPKCGCEMAYPTAAHLVDCHLLPTQVEVDWVGRIVMASKAFVASQHRSGGAVTLWEDLAKNLVDTLGLRDLRPVEPVQPNLGLATTAQLLDEIRARIDHDYFAGGGGLDYTTVDGRPKSRSVGRADG